MNKENANTVEAIINGLAESIHFDFTPQELLIGVKNALAHGGKFNVDWNDDEELMEIHTCLERAIEAAKKVS